MKKWQLAAIKAIDRDALDAKKQVLDAPYNGCERMGAAMKPEHKKLCVALESIAKADDWIAFCRSFSDIYLIRASAAIRELSAEVERLISANEHWHIRVQQLLSDKQNAQDAQESAEAELAKVKAHAERMCRLLQTGDGGFDRPETAAYRRDYPRGE